MVNYTNNKGETLTNSVVLVFMCFSIFLFAPLELFFSGIEEYWFSVYTFGNYLLFFFALSSVSLIIINILIKRYRLAYGWDYFIYVCFSICMALYVQGTYIHADYGQVDGQEIIWSQHIKDGIISIVSFIIVILFFLGIAIIKRGIYKKVMLYISVCMLLLQIATLSIVSIQNNGFSRKEKAIATTLNEWNYSESENFIIFLLDSFDRKAMNGVLDQNPEVIEEIFDGFTLYNNVTSMYMMTDYSVAQYLTGIPYKCEEGFRDYLDKAYKGSYLFNTLRKQKYDIGMYTDCILPNGLSDIQNIRISTYKISSHKRQLVFIFKLVGFRYLPQPLKQYCWVYPDDIEDLKMLTDDNPELRASTYGWTNKEFESGIANMTAYDNEKVFKFIHICSIHEPWKDRLNLYDETRYVLDVINNYIDELKKNNIFDNSDILILSDHGFRWGSEIYDNENPYEVICLYKERGVEHGFEIDETRTSTEKLDILYKHILEGKDISSDDLMVEERTVYDVIWGKAPTKPLHNVEGFAEYKSTEEASTWEFFSPTGIEYR